METWKENLLKTPYGVFIGIAVIAYLSSAITSMVATFSPDFEWSDWYLIGHILAVSMLIPLNIKASIENDLDRTNNGMIPIDRKKIKRLEAELDQAKGVLAATEELNEISKIYDNVILTDDLEAYIQDIKKAIRQERRPRKSFFHVDYY